MSDQPGLLREGFRRVWHYQRVLWFIFFFNFMLAHLGAGPATHKLDWATDHSLHAQRLSNMFDVGSFSELASNPEVKLFEVAGASIAFSLVFFGIVFFLTGGILEAYRADRKLTTREFFEACGSYFWRWVRLLMLMGFVVVPTLVAASSFAGWTGTLMADVFRERLAFWMLLAGLGVIGFLLMCIRLWFDMAQVRTVVEEETGMWRNAGRAFNLTLGNFGSLFWMYFRISVLGWLVFAAGLYLWSKMPPARFGWTILILELVVLWSFGTRLWQRACEMIWYQRRFLARVTAPTAAPPAPDPLLTIALVPTPPSQS
jgi:hypothetical protein